jgi:uncharacterized protein
MHEIPAGHFIPHLQPATPKENSLHKAVADIEQIRKKLFAYREKRMHPHKDDKILTDWNGLMIATLARGAQVFDEPDYAKAACRAMDFILQFMQSGDGRLLHRHRKGESAIAASVDDYAFIIWALLELYEATFQTRYLQRALDYQNLLFSRFRDEKNGGFFFTASDAEELLTRPKEFYDGAIPSGNSVAFINALRLSKMTGDSDMEKQVNDIYRAFRVQADAMPTGFTQFLCGLDFMIGPSSEVIVAGDMDKAGTQELLRVLRKNFTPNKVVLFRPEKPQQPDIETIAPAVQSYSLMNGKATAYVCTNFTCALPTNDPQKMLELLDPDKKR